MALWGQTNSGSDAALAGIRVRPGFKLELVATDPAIVAPVAMAFDENGRLFVLERPEHPGETDTNGPGGRIRVLEDTDGEGQYNASTLFATNLAWASALACYSGGVFVAAGPEILYLKGTQGAGTASTRTTVFAGLAITNRAGEMALANNFNWGLDNRVHAASGAANGIAPVSALDGAPPVSLAHADFSFDPRGLVLLAESGPGQSGLSFDSWGRKCVCAYARPLRTPMYAVRYTARNPCFLPPPVLLDAASPATPLFRVPGAPTNSPAAAWLTNAFGCVIYRGNAFPTNYAGNAFVADPIAHVVHRFALAEAGLEVKAHAPKEDGSTEFVASTDPAFCPVQLVNGPDGALYILDRRGTDDRGRIYRVVPWNFKRPKPLRLGMSTTYELVALLSHPNGWTRDTAGRVLYERRDPKAGPWLAATLATSRVPLTRLHALHALEGLNALSQSNILLALRDRDARVREQAVALCERFLQRGPLPEPIWNQLQAMANDPALRVRYQLAFTLGELHRPETAPLLAALLVRDPTNTWMQAAVFSSVANGAGDLFLALTRDGRVRRDPLGQDWLMRLARMIGLKGNAAEVAQLTRFVEQIGNDPLPAYALLGALGEGLHWTRSSLMLADADGRLQPIFAQAQNAVLTSSLTVPARVRAIELMGVGPFNFANAGDVLLLQLGSGQPAAIQSAALATLGRYADPRIVPAVVQRLRLLSPALRTDAVGALLARDERVLEVMTALEDGRIALTDLSSAQANFLRTHRNPNVRQPAIRLLGPVPLERPAVLNAYRPALSLAGNGARGRDFFVARCASCHAPGSGDLATARVRGREWVLRAIVEPNAAVGEDSLTCVAMTGEGEYVVGRLREETAVSIVVQPVKGEPVILPRDNILSLQKEPWSLMPERLENGWTPQNMADLLEYVLSTAP